MSLPLQFGDASRSSNQEDRDYIGISDAEIIELASAFRRFGYFRQDVNTGLMYMSEDARALHGFGASDEPVNMADMVRLVHPKDIELVLAGMEEALRTRKGASDSFRLSDGSGGYRTVRVVADFREDGSPGGELVGIIYEFFDKKPMAEFLESF